MKETIGNIVLESIKFDPHFDLLNLLKSYSDADYDETVKMVQNYTDELLSGWRFNLMADPLYLLKDISLLKYFASQLLCQAMHLELTTRKNQLFLPGRPEFFINWSHGKLSLVYELQRIMVFLIAEGLGELDDRLMP